LADKRTYIRVHDGMDEHPKIEPLSDKAFRVLMRTWFWCSRNKTDGRVSAASWAQRGTPKVRRELEVALVHHPGHACRACPPVPAGYVQMHDYLEHQRSAEEIAEAELKKAAGGRLGNHRRWHNDGVIHPDCEFCGPLHPSDPDPPPDRGPSHHRSDNRSHTTSVTDRFGSPEDREQRKETTHVGMARHDSNVREQPLPPGAAGSTGVEAFRLVRRVLGLDYPAVTCTALAYHAAELLQQYDEATVQAGLEDWRGRTGIGPGVLPSLVADVIKRRNGHARPGAGRPNADDTIRDLLGATGTEGATVLRLTRGGEP
jgi:hypothetical protein